MTEPSTEHRSVDPHAGWSTLPGLRSFQVEITSKEQGAAFLRQLDSGATSTFTTGETYCWTQGVRFSSMFIAQVRTSPHELSLMRRRAPSRRRLLVVLVRRGHVIVRADTGVDVSPDGTIHVVHPGSGGVSIAAISNAEIVIFTFDADEGSAQVDLSARGVRTRNTTLTETFFRILAAVATVDESVAAGTVNALRNIASTIARLIMDEVYETVDDDEIELEKFVSLVERRSHVKTFNAVDLARELGISVRSLERRCARWATSPAELIRRSRAERALRFLRESPSTDLEVAWQVAGFGSGEALRRAFHHFYDGAPREVAQRGDSRHD